jgi:3-dehydroquinate synthetase
MGMDKKVSDGRLKFVLARQLGDVIISDDVSLDGLRKLLTEQLS